MLAALAAARGAPAARLCATTRESSRATRESATTRDDERATSRA